MNIFALSSSPPEAARFHTDSHVIKMILESTQLLSTAVRLSEGTLHQFPWPGRTTQRLYLLPGESTRLAYNARSLSYMYIANEVTYKQTHINHPCAVWTRESIENWLWLRSLTHELLREYTHRFDKKHACTQVLEALPYPINLPQTPRTPFAQAMPEECQDLDPITAYRNYYNAEKRHLFKWTSRPTPYWITEQ